MTFDTAAWEQMGYDPTVHLLPELQATIRETALGTFIKHKFVNELMFPGFAQRYNQQLEYKTSAVAEAFHEHRWNSYVFLHERPWRFEALTHLMDNLNDWEFWQLTAEVWIDSENIRENQEEWDDLLRCGRADRQYMMTPEDREALAKMPNSLVIYQGHTTERDDGWSWTLKRTTAEWFANRFAMFEDSDSVLAIGTCDRDDVLAYFTGRGEEEILIDPDLVTIVESIILDTV